MRLTNFGADFCWLSLLTLLVALNASFAGGKKGGKGGSVMTSRNNRDRQESGGQRQGTSGPVRDVAISEVGKWVVKTAGILLLLVFGASILSELAVIVTWIVKQTTGEYFQLIKDLLSYGPFSHRGTQSLVSFLAITFVAAVLVRWIMKR